VIKTNTFFRDHNFFYPKKVDLIPKPKISLKFKRERVLKKL